MNIDIRKATIENIDRLVDLVGEYHKFESINSTPTQRKTSIEPLISDETEMGFVLLAWSSERCIGYVAICYGYSIELGGRDAFVDELFVVADQRGKGVGKLLVETATDYAKRNNVKVLHLEVANDNETARRFYQKLNFLPRSRFHLMSRKL